MKYCKNIEEMGLKKQTKLLAVFPHPDDESAFSAGFLRKAKRNGVNIKYICVTRGEKSTLRHGLKDNHKLEDIRNEELIRALSHLGIKEFSNLGIPDGEIEENSSSLKLMLKKVIKDFKPDFVLTLEPDGIYGHPDHIFLTKVLNEIFREDKFIFKLIYATVDSLYYQPSESSKKMVKSSDKIAPTKPSIILKLSLIDSYKKLRALQAHKSQFKVDVKFIRKWHKRKLIRTEMFYILD